MNEAAVKQPASENEQKTRKALEVQARMARDWKKRYPNCERSGVPYSTLRRYLPGWTRKILDKERRAKRVLVGRAPADWEQRIEQIEDRQVRIRVACIIWWDFYSGQPDDSAWHGLDHYLVERVGDISEDEMAAGLETLGYSPFQARHRAQGKLRVI